MARQALGDRAREAVAVDRQGAAGGQAMGIGRRQDQRAGAAHLLMQQADGVVLGIVGAQRVGADQLGAVLGLVRLGRAQRAHLVQHDGNAGLGQVPGGLAAGEAGADDVDGMGLGCGHGASDKGWAGGASSPIVRGCGRQRAAI